MGTAYNQINRLRAQGITWEQLGLELAKLLDTNKTLVARNTLRALQNQPHYKPGKDLSLAINTLHRRLIPNPFPAGVEGLMRLTRQLMQQAQSDAPTCPELNDLSCHVREQLQQTQQPLLIRVRLHWVLANIAQFYMRQARLQHRPEDELYAQQACAIQDYQTALSLLDHHQMPLERYKLLHNIFVCYVNAIPEAKRNQNPKLISELKSLDYLDGARGVLRHEGFQWLTARNALLYASICQHRAGVAEFYQALVQANKHFYDFSYRPRDCDSLESDPSLKWAREQVLTRDIVETLNTKLSSQKPLNKA